MLALKLLQAEFTAQPTKRSDNLSHTLSTLSNHTTPRKDGLYGPEERGGAGEGGVLVTDTYSCCSWPSNGVHV